MSLTIRNNYFSPGFLHNVQNAQHATRGTGANVHDSLRSLLYHLRVQHGFTLEDFALLHAAPDSPTRRSDLTPGEVERLIEGMFEDGFGAEVQRRNSGATTPPPAATDSPSMKKDWELAATCMMHENFREDCDFEDMLLKLSKAEIPGRGFQQFLAALDVLYKPSETISLVTACTPEGSPIANDKSMYPQGWRRLLTRPNNIGGKAGVWWRHNPVSVRGGSGKGGAVKDCDIPTPRYLLLENDVLPRNAQAAAIIYLMTRRKLPIRCVTDSGGKSLHALVELSPGHYAESANALLADLHREFGFDKGNWNPSRMSRAPGFVRGIGAKGDGMQRLLFLSPPDGVGFRYEPDWASWDKRFPRANGEEPKS